MTTRFETGLISGVENVVRSDKQSRATHGPEETRMIIEKPPQPLPGRSPLPSPAPVDPNPKVQTVLLIHGTNANQKKTAPDWWHTGSDFCLEVDALLQQKGSSARCWSHLAKNNWDPPFAWTGANSELARFTAGKALAEEITRLEEDLNTKQYHLVGHSHGGNVILLALRSLKFKPGKLGAVIFMGTPVLRFRHPEDFDVRWIAFPLYVTALVFCGWGFTKWGYEAWLITGTIAVFAALLAEIFLVHRRASRSDTELYGSGKPSAFMFEGDEALESLKMAEQIVRKPAPFIRQFTATEIKEHAFDPVSPSGEDFFSRVEQMVKETGAYRLFNKILHPPTLSSIMAKFEKAPPISPVTNPHVLTPPSIRSPSLQGTAAIESSGPLVVIENAVPQVKALRQFAAIVVGLMAFLPACLMLFAEMIFKSFRCVLLSIPRFFFWAVIKCSPPIISILLRLSVLGADKGKFLKVEELPPGVDKAENVLPALQDELIAVKASLGVNAGKVFLPALIHRDVFSIKTRVENSLSDLAIVHSHYYQSREGRERIATLIHAAEIRPRPSFSGAFTNYLKNLKRAED